MMLRPAARNKRGSSSSDCHSHLPVSAYHEGLRHSGDNPDGKDDNGQGPVLFFQGFDVALHIFKSICVRREGEKNGPSR